jgi:DNA replication protein DnaC
LSNSPATADQSQAYAAVRQYVATFSRQFDPDGEPIKSLYLVSPSPGTGKTTTAVAVLNAYIVAHYIGSLQRNRQALERPGYFCDVNEWQALFLGFTRPGIPRETAEGHAAEYYAIEQRVKAAPFAVLDDIGVRGASDAFRGDLHGVINARVSAGLPTVYTSNVGVSELAAIFDARLADRVRDQCLEVEFAGGSKRGFRKTEVKR